jgi:D-3-phosphoglycerate dehydrogenase
VTRRTVVVADPIHEAGIEDLMEDFDVIDISREPDEASQAAALKVASAIVVRQFLVDRDSLPGMPELKVAVKHGAGVDNIDLDAVAERGVAVRSTPGVGATAVAEQAVMLILAVCRRVVVLDRKVREGDFEVRNRWRLAELRDRAVGVVGLGNIGRRTADILHGFGARVSGYDPMRTVPDPERPWLTVHTSLDELLRTSSVISVHVPWTAETRGLIGREELSLLSDGAIVVNTSRGPLIDQAALTAELTSGRLSAGLDVFDPEPPDVTEPLFALDNVVLSPHIGGLTLETARNLSLACAAAVREELS